VRRVFGVALLLLTCYPLISETAPQAKPSLLFSCLERPFVSISASRPNHDALPPVSISVSDPSGRTVGPEPRQDNDWEATYGPVIQIPKMPQRSIAIAAEVCGATEGVYNITVTESGKGRYRLTADASIPNAQAEALILRHAGRPGRVWHYKVEFRREGDKVVLRWLDKNGTEQSIVEVPEW
jgi:hypothetical protein